MESAWLKTLKSAQKTCLVQDEKRKIHFTLSDGRELAEEYDVRTHELLVRKWRKKGGTSIESTGKWEFEVGEDVVPRILETEGLVASASNPIFLRKDTKKAFQWRIRNLPYPLQTYDVQTDPENKEVIVRTTNKKYYKKFSIPDMDRHQLELIQSSLSIAHANNTLIITYEKPPAIVEVERLLAIEFSKMKTLGDGDVECNPS